MLEVLSNHAIRRCAERGITGEILAMLLWHADREVPVGSGAVALSLTRTARDQLAKEGIGAQELDRLRRLVAVVAGATVITALHPVGRPGRVYRRGRKRAYRRGGK